MPGGATATWPPRWAWRPPPRWSAPGCCATLDVDLAAGGHALQALLAVRVRPPSRRAIEAFRDWAQALPETIGLFVVSGAEDFLLHVAVADNEALYAFVIDRLTERAEVADVRTSVVYEHLRRPPRIDPVRP
ncbi:hypothetical protein GCM10023162_20890 [Klenkia terrae]